MKKKPLYSFHVSSIFFGFTVIRKTTKDVSVMEPVFQKGKGGGMGGVILVKSLSIYHI